MFFLDINECLANNGGCSINAQCTNVIGGNRTCTCNAGYTGDGIVCTGESLTYSETSSHILKHIKFVLNSSSRMNFLKQVQRSCSRIYQTYYMQLMKISM